MAKRKGPKRIRLNGQKREAILHDARPFYRDEEKEAEVVQAYEALREHTGRAIAELATPEELAVLRKFDAVSRASYVVFTIVAPTSRHNPTYVFPLEHPTAQAAREERNREVDMANSERPWDARTAKELAPTVEVPHKFRQRGYETGKVELPPEQVEVLAPMVLRWVAAKKAVVEHTQHAASVMRRIVRQASYLDEIVEAWPRAERFAEIWNPTPKPVTADELKAAGLDAQA